MSVVSLYTDGACSGNPGPGGWAAILVYGEHEKALSGGEKDTTNQRMEIAAVVEGLKALTRPCQVKVYSDSAYVVNAFHDGGGKRTQTVQALDILLERLQQRGYQFVTMSDLLLCCP